MSCSISWFKKRLAHASQRQLWHRDVDRPTSAPALSSMNPTSRTTGRGTHISITSGKEACLFPEKSQKPYQENFIKNIELLHIKENPFPSYLYWRLQNSHLSLCCHFSCYRRACSLLLDTCILCSTTRKHSQNFSSL